jgi:hypothetical protein
MNTFAKKIWLFAVLCGAFSVSAAQYVVDQKNAAAKDENPGNAEKPFLTINKAAAVARAGDTVFVKPGIYREFVGLYHSGTPEAPIRIQADPPGSVVVSGADIVANWEGAADSGSIYFTPWKNVFAINVVDGKLIESHPDDTPLWGRAEQAFADGKHLRPCLSLDELRKAWDEHSAAMKKEKESGLLRTPLPNLGAPFAGMFFADTVKDKRLYLWLADGSDPRKHQIELSTRDLVMGSNPWAFKDGTQNVQVSGFIFQRAATFPQRPGVWLLGKNNLLENCIIEEMAGNGAGVNGTMRRCILRRNGHCGGGAYDDGFVNEECLWEENAWKPIDRGWDSAGLKLCAVDGGLIQKCVFRHNGGAGLWFDIHARNILVTDSVFWENECSGLMIEISRNIRVIHNLAVRNAVNMVGKVDGDAFSGGIFLAESENCIVAWNTCVGNTSGIAFREQGPRLEKTTDYGDIQYHLMGDVVVSNVCADNASYPIALWSDNSFFGWHPSEKEKFKSEDAWQRWILTTPACAWDPAQCGLVIDRNLYFNAAKQPEFLYGVTWRPKHQVFSELPALTKVSGFEARSRIGDPKFEDAAKNNFRIKREGAAWEMQAGWLTAPPDLDAWTKDFLPKFR